MASPSSWTALSFLPQVCMPVPLVFSRLLPPGPCCPTPWGTSLYEGCLSPHTQAPLLTAGSVSDLPHLAFTHVLCIHSIMFLTCFFWSDSTILRSQDQALSLALGWCCFSNPKFTKLQPIALWGRRGFLR